MKHNSKYKNILTKEFLIKEYTIKEKSTPRMAKEIKCSRTAIRNGLLKYDIKIRTGSECRRGSKNPMYNKHHSEEAKKKISLKALDNHWAQGAKRPSLTLLNKSRVGNPIRDEVKKKMSTTMLKYWESPEGIKQKIKLSKINKEWAKQNPQKKIDAAMRGQQACPRISSLEIKVQKMLEELSIKYVSQYKYTLGFADIFIKPNKIIFVNGDYWHNYPHGTEKDAKQLDYLKEYGYETLIIWEHELNDLDKTTKKLLNFFAK